MNVPITPDHARRILLRHAGQSDDYQDGFLGWLRPYRGLNPDHLVEIVLAVHAMAPSLCSRETDRTLIGTIWDLCFTARIWTQGPREPMFHGRDFISPADKSRLDDWLVHLEQWVILLLRRGDTTCEFDWHVFQRIGAAAQAGPIVPHLVARLNEQITADANFEHDDKIPYCELLAAMGPVATPATDVLDRLRRHTQSEEVRQAAAKALAAIRPEMT